MLNSTFILLTAVLNDSVVIDYGDFSSTALKLSSGFILNIE